MYFTFSESAKKDVSKLPKTDQARLKKKLIYWQGPPEALAHAKALAQHVQATHRFRLGSYRVLVKVIDQEMRILRIRHRKDVYKR